MPYPFVQYALTILFDLVLVFGIAFFLIACGKEASYRQALVLSGQSLPLAQAQDHPLALPMATTTPLPIIRTQPSLDETLDVAPVPLKRDLQPSISPRQRVAIPREDVALV